MVEARSAWTVDEGRFVHDLEYLVSIGIYGFDEL